MARNDAKDPNAYLLPAIVAALERGDCPDRQWPDRKGEYWALCPYHADRHSGSFSVSEAGFKCHACGELGGLRKLAERLGVAELHASAGGKAMPTPLPCTLENYANVKGLPAEFLAGLGLADVTLSKSAAVKMPYFDGGGAEVAARFRTSLGGDNRFRWRSGSHAMPYGLWRLAEAQRAGYVLIVEGESDSQTLWHHGLPALGIPGATVWRNEWAEYLDGLQVYIWRESDAAGQSFAERIGKSMPDARIITPPAGRKDISDCHLAGDDVPAVVESLRRNAQAWRELQAEALNQQAAEARRNAGELLTSPDLLAEFDRLCLQSGLVGELRTARILFLAMVSRLLERPISVAVKGPSSGGKSFTVGTVLSAFPTSSFYALSSLSERALAYSEEPLQHRMLVLYEAAGLASEFGSYLMRTLLSEGCVRYETVEKTSEGLKPRLIERQGPTGLIVTTTWASMHPENETRMLSLLVRDDRQQTLGVLRALADRNNGTSPALPDYASWHALQTWLELAGVRAVSIPFAHTLAERTDPAAVRIRRDFGAVLGLVQAHAILHQATRERDDQGRIVATLVDYRAVYDLVADIVSEGVQAAVNPTVRETVETVAKLTKGNADLPNVADIAKALDVDKSSAGRRVRVALELGYLVNQEDKKNRPKRLALGEALPAERGVLPHPADLEGGEGSYIPPYERATAQPSERHVAYDALEDWQKSILSEFEAQNEAL